MVEMMDRKGAEREESQQRKTADLEDGASSSGNVFTLDEALAHVGGWGKFQKWHTFSMGVCWLITGMYAFGPVTWAPRMNRETGWGGCREEQFANTLYFAAQLTGNAVFAPTADKYGRRITLIITMGVASLGGCICFSAYNLPMYIFGRLVSGFGTSGITLISTVLLSEVVSQEVRALVICFILQIMYSFGMMAAVPVSRLASDWRGEVMVTTLGALLWFPFLLYGARESPRFLLSVNQPGQCLREFREIGVRNGRPLPDTAVITLAHASSGKPQMAKTYTLLDLMRHPLIRGYTLNMCLQWLIIGTVYFGITLASGQLGGDAGANLFILALVEIPAYWIGFQMMDRVGRRPVLLGCHLVSFLACALYPLAPPAPPCVPGETCAVWSARLALAVVGKMGVSGTFGCAYVYCTELFPTVVRNLGTGVATQFANFGALIAPQLLLLGGGGGGGEGGGGGGGDGATCEGSNPGNVMVLFGVLAGLAGGVALLLPETLGVPLAETMELSREGDGGKGGGRSSSSRAQVHATSEDAGTLRGEEAPREAASGDGGGKHAGESGGQAPLSASLGAEGGAGGATPLETYLQEDPAQGATPSKPHAKESGGVLGGLLSLLSGASATTGQRRSPGLHDSGSESELLELGGAAARSGEERGAEGAHVAVLRDDAENLHRRR